MQELVINRDKHFPGFKQDAPLDTSLIKHSVQKIQRCRLGVGQRLIGLFMRRFDMNTKVSEPSKFLKVDTRALKSETVSV